MTLKQFVDEYEGKTVGYPHGSYTGECLSLVKHYIKEVFNIDPPPSGCNAARCYWSKFPDPLGTVFKKVPNTPDLMPQEGWIAVWNGNVGNGYGHIAIVLEADVNQFISFDQNYYGKHAHKQKHNYNNLYGFLVPKETMPNLNDEIIGKSSQRDKVVNYYNLEIGTAKDDELLNKIKPMIDKPTQDLKKCELAKSEMGDKVKEARERIEQLEKDLETEKRSKAQMVSRADYNQLLEEKQTLGEKVEELENKPALVGKRKLVAGIVAGVLILISVILEKSMGLDLSPQDLLIILAGPVSYIGAEGTADIIRVIKDQQGLLLSEKTDK